MIACIFHEGSGMGNQLARYVFARVKAADLGVPFGVINPENFKGQSRSKLSQYGEYSFMNLDMGVPVKNLLHEFNEEKVTNEHGNDVRPYDIKSEEIKDFTLVDGEFQDPKYFMHRLDEVREWLKVEPLEMDDNLCVIGFRGGEYVGVKDLFLPKSYWQEAIKKIQDQYPTIQFEVHTDDVATACQMFDFIECKVMHDIGLNWRSVRYAKHLIIANSSFYILPSLLNQEVKEIIAPMYWAGYNKGYWQLEQNKYNQFTYI